MVGPEVLTERDAPGLHLPQHRVLLLYRVWHQVFPPRVVAHWEKKEEDGQAAKTEAVLRSIFGPFTEKEKEEQRRRLEESCPAMYRDEEGDTDRTQWWL